jgi:hypothetical protein
MELYSRHSFEVSSTKVMELVSVIMVSEIEDRIVTRRSEKGFRKRGTIN